MSYNGWPNYETWNVSMWLNNEPSTYYELCAILESDDNDYTAGKTIRNIVEDMNPLADSASMFSDLISAALNEVDWEEIARANREDEEGSE